MSSFKEDGSIYDILFKHLSKDLLTEFRDSFVKKINSGEFDSILKEANNRINLADKNIEKQSDLISPSQTCKLFNPPIGRTTLYNHTKKGLLNSYRIGRRVFYSRQEIISKLKSIKKYERPP